MDLQKLLEQAKTQTNTTTENRTITEDIIATMESETKPNQTNSDSNNEQQDNGKDQLDELITIEELDPSRVFTDTDFFWKFEDGTPVVYRTTKTGEIKKFEKRSKSFKYMSPVLLEKLGAKIIRTQYIERGQFMVVFQTEKGQFLILDDFTSQTLGKVVNLSTFELYQFKHNKQDILNVIDLIG